MFSRTWAVIGAFLAAVGVAAGAYHAHGLEKRLTAMLLGQSSSASVATLQPDPNQQQELNRRLGFWDTATRYQMYHAIGLVLVGLLAERRRSAWTALSGVCMLIGIVLFSGLLDIMALGGPKWLGAIVPLGGLSMIIGWLALAFAASKRCPATDE